MNYMIVYYEYNSTAMCPITFRHLPGPRKVSESNLQFFFSCSNGGRALASSFQGLLLIHLLISSFIVSSDWLFIGMGFLTFGSKFQRIELCYRSVDIAMLSSEVYNTYAIICSANQALISTCFGCCHRVFEQHLRLVP